MSQKSLIDHPVLNPAAHNPDNVPLDKVPEFHRFIRPDQVDGLWHKGSMFWNCTVQEFQYGTHNDLSDGAFHLESCSIIERFVLSPADYVNADGTVCPQCESKDLTATAEAEPSGVNMFTPIKCDSCGASWTDVYTLSGFENFVPGKNDRA